MLKNPTREQIAEIIEEFGMTASAEEVTLYRDLVEATIAPNAALDEFPDEEVQPGSENRQWSRPEPDDNPFNAWYVKTHLTGADSGPLSGRTVAIKDNIFVAGVPLTNGTRILEGYTPPVDATVVKRILDAGGIIKGKAVCEAYCLSSASHTSDTGPVRNPHNPAHTTGGSSSGSAALVASGEVDLALGCDQGGSIRMPASFCGIYGMKPTQGLVPYTGILGMAPVIDHVGPMTSNVADNALMLETIAGADGIDSRQYNPKTSKYTDALNQGIPGLRIGVLSEGFGHENSEDDVDTAVRAAAEHLGNLGAEVVELSIPMHQIGAAISFAVLQDTLETIFHHDGCTFGRLDPIAVSFVHKQQNWRACFDDLTPHIKVMLIGSEFIKREHGNHYFAKGTNMVRKLRAAYDEALEGVDLLLMPTTPMKATLLPPPDVDPATSLGLAFGPLANTMPFDSTQHPAMSIPCGMSDGLPIGMMLVGKHFDESTIYRAAAAFEREVDWRSL